MAQKTNGTRYYVKLENQLLLFENLGLKKSLAYGLFYLINIPTKNENVINFAMGRDILMKLHIQRALYYGKY